MRVAMTMAVCWQLATCYAPADTLTLAPCADRGLTCGDFAGGLRPQDPDGKAEIAWVSQLVWWEMNQMLLRFDLSALPAGQRVVSARMALHVAELDGQPTKVRVCTLLPFDVWDETTASCNTRDAQNAWSAASFYKSAWKTVASAEARAAGEWVSWDVTSAVRDWAEGRWANTGFLLQPDYRVAHWGDLDNSPGKVGLHTREAADASLRPMLTIDLEPLPSGATVPTRPPAATRPSELLRMPAPPYVIWYQCPYLDDLRHANVDASVGSAIWAFENHARGICSLMWTYGPNSPYGQDAEYYREQYTSAPREGYAGCAVDEWNVEAGDAREAWCAEGMRAAKQAYPGMTLAVWVTHPTPTFLSLVRDGIIDLALLEGYTYVPDHPEWAIGWDDLIRHRVELMKREGLLDRTVVCVGMVAAGPDAHGNRMTAQELQRQLEYLKTHYPEMPGIAFYGWNDGAPETRELVRLADELAGRLWPRAAAEGP